MQEQTFWTIIEAARSAAGDDTQARIDTLQAQLSELDIPAIQGFAQRYEEMIDKADRWDLWGAAYLINGGCSDDGFRYFRDWLISEGRITFERALSDPDSLADLPQQDECELESFGDVVRHLHEARGAGDLPQDPAARPVSTVGEQWEEEDLPTLFPRLAEKYWT